MGDPRETERLAELDRFEVLDTPPEPLFDSLTELAARTFEVPICLISLVDQDRQWFKSRVGLDVESTPRGISFCQHAILSDDVFVVRDASRDERFRENPLVVGSPDIRFYAGAPLITARGHRLGTLCIIDRAPRETFSPAEAARLHALADSVMQALVLRMDSRERDRIAALAEERNQLLAQAEQMAGVGVWSWDAGRDKTVWSDQVARIHGFEPGGQPPDLQGVLACYHPDDARTLAGHVQRAVASGVGYQLDARLYRPDGSLRHVVATGACRQAPDGTVTGLFGTFQDVTDQVGKERFVRAITDNLPGMVAYWDSDMRCRFANAAHGEWFGRSPDSMLGLSLRELLGDAMFADVEPNMREALKGRSQAFERTVVKPSGEIGHTWAHYVPDIDPDGQTIGLYVLASDVTALKRAEARLRETNLLLEEARDRAEAATVAKSEFLANMSHEIRTPLTAILGFTGLLSDNPQLPETARAHVFRIKGASAGLLSIVNDILDFSTLEARQAVVTPRPVNVIDLARDTLGVFELQAAAKALRLDLDVAPAVPSCVAVDPDRLRQILMNLIGNAVKFTDQGKIGLTLDYQADSQVLHVKVEDSGSGMDEAQRARLFQRFSQVDAPSTRRHGGSGLGLAICKGLTEAMGGQIGVASRPGQGSVFFFHIQAPTSSGPALVQGADRSTPLSGLRVLVADDHPANRELARVLLEQLEAEVTDVKDGAELVREAAERPYDVILADLRMPRLDGRAALRAIRSVPGPNQQAPILAFTADPPGSVDIGPGAFDGVVFKPITPSNLISALIQATQRPPLRRRLG